MKKVLSLLVTAGALLVAGACGHTPSASRQEVRFVTERDQVDGCAFLGEVDGSSSYGGISGQKLGKVRAEAEMRHKAERMGADVVLVHSSRGGFWGAKSSGAAYQCQGRARAGKRKQTPRSQQKYTPPREQEEAPPPEQEDAPPPGMPTRGGGGCEKDTDCKGDRVCEFGRCINP